MKSSLTRIGAVLFALAAACGGSSGNAALSKTFSYGAPATPTAAETSAANAAQSGLSDTTSFSATPNASKGLEIVAFADELAALSLGEAGIPGSRARENLGGALRTAASIDTCATVTATSVTFTNCTVSDSGFSITLNGTVTVSAGTVTWNITGNFSGVEQGITFNINHHQSGTFTVTATKVTGNSVSDFGGTVSGNGQSVSFGLATAAIVDLTYQTTPSFCVTSGSVEVKRVWSQKPNGASGAAFADAGVKLTWTGCNAIQIAHSQ